MQTQQAPTQSTGPSTAGFGTASDHFRSLAQIARWSALVLPVAALSGTASAAFLVALDWVTQKRFEHPSLLFFLPLAGVAIVWSYARYGRGSERGNNLIVDEIHQPGGGVPARMAPFVLVATLVTHLFGGSAGREGTAVQMGGSLASAWGRLFKLKGATLRVLLMSGVAAGFGSIFGTPLTGAVFALEVLSVGRIELGELIPVFVASVVGDRVCAAWGVSHSEYHIAVPEQALGALSQMSLLGKAAVGGLLFGAAAILFVRLEYQIKSRLAQWVRWPLLRPVVGALVVIALTYALGTRDYVGLGVHGDRPGAATLLSAFHAGGMPVGGWFWKLLLTAITLGAGFKGGEVTPLFFIGAALGNALAGPLGVPVDLMAGLGFVAVFAAAANTPLACTLMGIELFGGHYAVLFGAACFVAYAVSGHRGIYHAQRVAVPKA